MIELQKIDCNCNDCIFMQRNMERNKQAHEWHSDLQYKEWLPKKEKAIRDAQQIIDDGLKFNNKDLVNSGNGQMRVANKMKFQFEKKGIIQHGFCEKFEKAVTFIPTICQLETQKCFQHRRDFKTEDSKV